MVTGDWDTWDWEVWGVWGVWGDKVRPSEDKEDKADKEDKGEIFLIANPQSPITNHQSPTPLSPIRNPRSLIIYQ
jgi:hypothetical protein